MASKTKAIVPAHGTASLSQTVDSKDLSNPLKAVGLPKIQSSQGYNFGVYKWFLKNISEFEIEHGFNDINPWEVVRKNYPENWFFRPKDVSKPQEYYQSILEETGSARIKHNFNKHHKGLIAYSSIQIKRVVYPKDWPISSLYTATQFKTLKKYSTLYNYFDYIDAWTNIFCIQNPTTTHSWLIYFDQQSIKTTTKFSNWFLKWWQYRGITDEILSPEVLQVYQYFKTHYKPHPSEKYIPPLMYFCTQFFIPWVYQWYFDFQYTTELNILARVKKHKVKWWGSFKNSTKTPEEYKIICQQIFSQLGSGETVKSEELKERKSSSKESSKHSSSKKAPKKKSSRRKPKRQSSSKSESTASSTSSSSKNPASSQWDSNEDDCYGI
ncbi:hypothetical protein MANES_18G139633v8, partial [Manihot esculenta]